jgi:hypothetical protein
MSIEILAKAIAAGYRDDWDSIGEVSKTQYKKMAERTAQCVLKEVKGYLEKPSLERFCNEALVEYELTRERH